MSPMFEPIVRLQKLGFSPRAVLDIGAYAGTWTRAVLDIFPACTSFMIEALKQAREPLRMVCGTLNGRADFEIAVLGAEPREQQPFYIVQAKSGSSGSSLYEEQTQYPRIVEHRRVVRLDDVLASRQLGPHQLVKLDVQGAEIDVLRGGPRCLAAAEAVVLELSLLEYNRGAPLMHEVLAFMAAQGFLACDFFEPKRDPAGHLIQIDAIFVRRESPLRRFSLPG